MANDNFDPSGRQSASGIEHSPQNYQSASVSTRKPVFTDDAPARPQNRFTHASYREGDEYQTASAAFGPADAQAVTPGRGPMSMGVSAGVFDGLVKVWGIEMKEAQARQELGDAEVDRLVAERKAELGIVSAAEAAAVAAAQPKVESSSAAEAPLDSIEQASVNLANAEEAIAQIRAESSDPEAMDRAVHAMIETGEVPEWATDLAAPYVAWTEAHLKATGSSIAMIGAVLDEADLLAARRAGLNKDFRTL